MTLRVVSRLSRLAIWNAFVVVALTATVTPSLVLAGPPYVSDDAEPTDTGHWEVYSFVSGTRTGGSTAGQGGLDINYGALADLQLTMVLPLDYARSGSTNVGVGEVELAGKLRIFHQSDDGFIPDLAIFPRIFIPSATGQFGGQGASLLVPVWFEKDDGAWSWFGGGGVQFNFGPGQHNFGIVGLALQRKIDSHLSLGGEIFHQSRSQDQAIAYTGVNIGLTYQFSEHIALLGSFGPGLENAASQGRANFYTALDFTW